MKSLTIKNIAKACNGKIYNYSDEYSSEVTDVVIDSRKVTQGCLFVAIKGNRVDGHDFASQVLANGALCVVSEKVLNISKPYIVVESTTDALMDIAAYYRSVLDIKVIGITGSVGKTSTKEMISSVLAEKYNILKTEGNFNNEIGLPLTIFRLRQKHQIAILELGISHLGDMTKLARIAKPDVCVITNIGMCHLENLIDRDGVLKAKTEMFDFIEPGGSIVLNNDDNKLCTIQKHNDNKIYFYGIDTDSEIHGGNITALGLKGTFFTLTISNEKPVDVYIKIPGYHMVYNALAAAAVGKIFNISTDAIKHGIENMHPVAGRINVIETEHYTLIDDCYNANPVSVKAAIDVLVYGKGRKVAILGDMFELGDNEDQLHQSVGEYVSKKNINLLICIGKLSKNISNAALKSGMNSNNVKYYSTKDEFFEEANSILIKGDNILIKASHGMEFSKIVEFITQNN